MVVRGVVFVVAGVLTAVPAFAQEPVRSRVPGTPRAQIWINGEEVDPMGWVANRRARLGVTLDMRASENDSIGATISSVTPGGPAAKAGLRSGDIITKIDGKALVRGERERAESKSDADEDQVDQSVAGLRLVELVSKLEPGDTVPVEYRRGKETRLTQVALSKERTMAARSFGDGNFNLKMPEFEGGDMPRVRGLRSFGGEPGERSFFSFGMGGPFADLELAPINESLGSYFGVTDGVLVIDAPTKNTLGLKGGDVILSVDGRKARGPASLLRILQSYEDGDVIKLEIMRNKARQTVTSKVDHNDED